MSYVATLTIILINTGSAPLAESKDWSAEIEAVAKKCGVPPKQLQLIDRTVRFRASETTTFDQVKCVFDELKVRGAPTMQGYIGTGSYPPNPGHSR